MKKVIKEEFIFLVLVCLVFAFGAYTLVKNPKKTSVAENRNLTQFSHFTISNFLNGKFQDNFEKALADQFPMSEKIRVNYGEAITSIPSFGLDKNVCKDRYMYFNGKTYTNAVFDCDDYVLPPSMDIDSKQRKLFHSNIVSNNIEKYNHINSIADAYYYYVEEPQVFNFEKNERIVDFEEILRNELKGDYKLDSFRFDSYDEYKEYFYKTDHHWNYIASYQGYLDAAKMLGVKNPVEPIGIINNHEYFFGSKARDSQNYNIMEEFVAYDFKIPEHDVYIDGKPNKCEHLDEFANHEYDYQKNFNFYNFVYGDDYGEVLYDFHQPEKENLLIISNSFGRPLRLLLAQHFNKTYGVDLRWGIGNNFHLSEYIKEKDIDKVLLIINPRFLHDKYSNRGLEE